MVHRRSPPQFHLKNTAQCSMQNSEPLFITPELAASKHGLSTRSTQDGRALNGSSNDGLGSRFERKRFEGMATNEKAPPPVRFLAPPRLNDDEFMEDDIVEGMRRECISGCCEFGWASDLGNEGSEQ